MYEIDELMNECPFLTREERKAIRRDIELDRVHYLAAIEREEMRKAKV